MRQRRMTDTEAQQLLAGQALEGRPEFDALAHAVGEFRAVAYSRTPQPSAALQERLDAPHVTGVAAAGTPTRGITKMLATISGLGIATKLALGTGAFAIGVAGVGAAGALPGPVQDSFDSVVSTVVTDDEELLEEEILEEETLEEEVPEDGTIDDGTSELPVGSEEFGKWVSDRAQDPDKVGSEFGESVSEQARELRDENRAARNAGDGETESDSGVGDDETGEEEEESSSDDSVEQSTERGGQGNGKGGRP